MTAAALEGDRERFIAAGMDGYVSKPLGLAPLAAALSQCAPAATAAKPAVPLPAHTGQPIDEADFAQRMGAGQEELLWALVDAFCRKRRRKCPAYKPP
jgi:two-component system sensor histidine kinase/response regulator